MNHLYHLGGSITNHLLGISCNDCCVFLQDNLPDDQFYGFIKFYNDTLNKGGFKVPCTNLLLLILHCEMLYSKYKMFILRNSCTELIKIWLIFFKYNTQVNFNYFDEKSIN